MQGFAKISKFITRTQNKKTRDVNMEHQMEQNTYNEVPMQGLTSPQDCSVSKEDKS